MVLDNDDNKLPIINITIYLIINNYPIFSHYDLFIPRQSKLEVISNNTADNNTQERGVNLIGYYL